VIGVVERSVALFDGTRVFRRTSPDEGSIHTYPDMDPTWYQHLYGRVPFVSETGMHSFPEAALLRELVDENEFSQPLSDIFESGFAASHPELLQHFAEYNPRRVPRMVSRASHVDDISAPSLETLAEASQIGAGEFYQILSELLQANYPVTAGLMPWVYKRPHPTIAIQLVDGMGHAGAPYYQLKRTYEPVHVMVQLPHLIWATGEPMPVEACVLNLTSGEGLSGTLDVSILDAAFVERWRRTKPVATPAAPAVLKAALGEFEIPGEFADTLFYLVAELWDAGGSLVSRSVYWPRCLSAMDDAGFQAEYRARPQPALTLSKGPWLKPQVAAHPTTLALEGVDQKQIGPDRSVVQVWIRNTGQLPAFPVHIDLLGARRAFYASDNDFWLAPQEQRKIEMQILWREPASREATVCGAAWNAEPVRRALA
jgi:beta-mannosidase